MKNYIYFLLAIVALLLVGCESGASFTVVNKSNYPLYASIGKQAEVTIPGQSTYTWDVDTDTQYFFGGEVKKKVKVRMKGETYLMFDEALESYVDTTYVYLKAGEKRNAFIWPNRAGVEIQNQSNQIMTSAKIFRHDGLVATHVVSFEDLEPGESTFSTLPPATPSNSFYYLAVIEMEDGTEYTYGDQNNILRVDEQFLVILSDPQPPL
ncbi:MAG TPA: hypothetical protein PL126_04250 [Candidatus Cloacimonadota bacterium]|nr:hypothetical protein [Candidatus Cloacimonadota bacterium]